MDPCLAPAGREPTHEKWSHQEPADTAAGRNPRKWPGDAVSTIERDRRAMHCRQHAGAAPRLPETTQDMLQAARDRASPGCSSPGLGSQQPKELTRIRTDPLAFATHCVDMEAIRTFGILSGMGNIGYLCEALTTEYAGTIFIHDLGLKAEGRRLLLQDAARSWQPQGGLRREGTPPRGEEVEALASTSVGTRLPSTGVHRPQEATRHGVVAAVKRTCETSGGGSSQDDCRGCRPSGADTPTGTLCNGTNDPWTLWRQQRILAPGAPLPDPHSLCRKAMRDREEEDRRRDHLLRQAGSPWAPA